MRVFVRYHEDLDGTMAAIIMEAALRQRYPDAEFFFVGRKTLKPSEVRELSKKLNKYDLVVFLDTGAERGTEINKYFSEELREKTWIIDHHRRFDRPRPDVAVYVNPEEENKDSLYYATASTLVYRFVREHLGFDNYRYTLPAVLGAYSDLADFFGGLHGLNAEVAREAVESGMFNETFGFTARFKDRDVIMDVVDENYYPIPVPGFRAVLPRKYSSVKYYKMSVRQIERMAEDLRDVYDGMYDWAFRDTLYLRNGSKHYGEIHDAVSTLEEYAGTFKTTWEAFRGIRKAIEKLMRNRAPAFIPPVRNRKMGSKIIFPKPVETEKYYVIDSRGRFIHSSEATFIATRYFTDKPVIVIGYQGKRAYVTARMHPSLYGKYDLGAEMYEILQKKLGGYGGGHHIAAGGGIDRRRVHELIEILSH